MRRLADLLPVLQDAAVAGSVDRPVAGIEFWSDEVAADDLFVAIPGHPSASDQGFAEAIARGAGTILCRETSGAVRDGITTLRVPDPIRAMGRIAHAFHDFPSHRLKVVGVTGTNGKTSTAALLHRLFRALGRRAGLLSNIGDWIDGEAGPPVYTTGHALFLSAMMARMAAAGCSHCFMEVSSQGIAEQRIEGVEYAGAIFTNLSRDHLDWHGSMAAYAAAKRSWFDALPATAFAITNADDPRGAWMVERSAAHVIRYGIGAEADIRYTIEAETIDGLLLDIAGHAVRSPLLGAFNAANLAAVFAAACALGEDPERVAAALATIGPIEGRMQTVRASDGRIAVIDYAHGEDAIRQVLRHLRNVAPEARIVTVIGTGGGGDPRRRPLIAAAAAVGSDRLILTSDNPRDDDPAEILRQMGAGLDAAARAWTTIVEDRREAIRRACAEAGPGDVVLIAGKGHERTQEIAGVRHPFDDAEEARAALAIS